MARIHIERLVSFDTMGVDHLMCLLQVAQLCSIYLLEYSHFLTALIYLIPYVT